LKVWLNEKLCDARDARAPVLDHGFLYGDGVYETVRAYRYKVFHWGRHDVRLRNSARRIALRCPWSSARLLQRVVKVLQANHEPDASVRITITRGPGPLGLDPAVCPRPTLAMIPHPARPLQKIWARGVSIGIVRIRRTPRESLDPQIKSNNSLNTILAKMEAKKMGVFEAILTNLRGDMTEGTTSNIFFVSRGTVFTPSLSCGLLEGITREVLVSLARKEGLPVREGRYRPRELLRADECFLSSTTLEVAPVIRCRLAGDPHSHRIGSGVPGPITRRLHALFRAAVKKELQL
jgi:branched-chain amino acid aminotransferase